jgi:phosphoribosyl-AMP cyclohydrolase
LLLKVEQLGAIACHTGRASCFYRRLDKNSDQETNPGSQWVIVDPVLKDPELIYK